MKFFLFALSCTLLSGFMYLTGSQERYLPVYISMIDTAFIPRHMELNLKAAFGTRKIKTITRKEAEEYIHSEVSEVTENYYRSGGKATDYYKLKEYQAKHMRSVGSFLSLRIRIDSTEVINDTVKWRCWSIPFNMIDPQKPKWHYMLLDSTNAPNLLQMAQSIVDSVIASKVLIKE